MSDDAPRMRVVRVHAFGGPERLRLEEAPVPACPDDGYLVRTRAVGLDFADVLERRGTYRRAAPLPFVPGKEASGEVVARGPHATRFAVGDAVVVVRFENGCCAEVVAARDDQALPVPRGLDLREAAVFAGGFLTAWLALREVLRVRAGDALLVTAAAGGLGTAALQLGLALGCAPVVGAVGSARKTTLVRELGAHACVDLSREPLADSVRRHTGGRGVDACLESVGGAVFDEALLALAPLGHLAILGFSSVERDHAERVRRVHPLTLLHRSISVGGLDVEALAAHRRRDDWDALCAFRERHGLRPVIGAVRPLGEVAEAHAALEARETTGRTVLVPDGASSTSDARQNWK